MTDRRRHKSERSGRWSELAALWALRLKGYRLLAHRFKCPLGEVDLIMRRGRTTAFIEVKTRATADDAVIAVTGHQSRRGCGWRATAWPVKASAVLTSSPSVPTSGPATSRTRFMGISAPCR